MRKPKSGLSGVSAPGVSGQADLPGAALIAACRELYAAIDQLDHAAATKVGISRNDLRALNLMEGGPTTPGVLARELALTSGAVTSLIDRLENKGLVKRARDPSDRRAVQVEPTPAMFAALGPLYRGVAERLGVLATAYGNDEEVAAARHLRDAARMYTEAAADQPSES